MTLKEIRDTKLIGRVGFRASLDPAFTMAPDAANSATTSGLHFQDEINFVSLNNIEATMEVVTTDAAVFNTYLLQLKETTILLALNDIFENCYEPSEAFIDEHIAAFDRIISKRMAIVVAEQILFSKRSNLEERIGKKFTQQIFFELNGNTDSNKSNFPQYIGLRERYREAVEQLKSCFGQVDALDVHSYTALDYEDNQNTFNI